MSRVVAKLAAPVGMFLAGIITVAGAQTPFRIEKSKGPADIYKVPSTIPGETLVTPAAKSGCLLTAG